MIIYFADRKLNILGQASTSLPRGFLIVDDVTTEEIESGVNSFSCTIAYNTNTRAELEAAVSVGKFILKGSGNAFTDKENSYDSLYTIVETEFNTDTQELHIYAEDAGLDLINKVVPAQVQSNKTLVQMINSVKPSDWVLNTVGVPTGTKSYEWEGENTATERINSIANLFGCEVYYSFVIERFQITEKVINVVAKRGSQEATAQLRLNLDINSIVTTTSIEELATAYQVTGGTPSNSSTPINLKGYSYSYTDPITKDVYVVDSATGQMRNKNAMARWASALDPDGLIVKQYTYDTTNKATLAGAARAELQKHCNAIVNYDVDFANLPSSIQIGDRINIIDEEGSLYLEARLLRIETSVTAGTRKAVIGETLIRSSGISDKVQQLASQFSEIAQQRKFFTWIAYADNENGDGISLNAVGKSFMGVLPNMLEELTTVTQAEERQTDFKWSLYQASTIYLESTEGTTFKGKPINTRIDAVVYRGTVRITDGTTLRSYFGDTARLKWYEKIQDAYVEITGSRISSDGFHLTVDSTSGSLSYVCELVT